MAVHYEVLAGKTLIIQGPANVRVTGGETPVVGSIDDIDAAKPTVSAIDPDTAEVGAADLVMTVTGTGFTATSTIVMGVVDTTTNFGSDTELSTTVSPTLFVAGPVPVSVRNGPAQSDPVDFTFTDPGTTSRKRGGNDGKQSQKQNHHQDHKPQNQAGIG